ncbi:hypothetical protein ElyMa_000816100 [Elysia marginata]|uniref:Uncharacterized protein n=1 Tax=Elysia marginata TaxID=1093978 RepID=A0AAV4GY69_9GAST|nr:hypothetical protein ElyMa_000816100 [Elysia marginata]
MRVTAGVSACGQRRPMCSTRTLRPVTPRRRNDTDPQQPGSVKKMSGFQERTPVQNNKCRIEVAPQPQRDPPATRAKMFTIFVAIGTYAVLGALSQRP